MYSFDAIVRYSETHGRPEADAATIANYFQDCAISDLLADRCGAISGITGEDQGWNLGI